MPQGGAAKKLEPQASDKNRSSSNAAKRATFSVKITPVNDNSSAPSSGRSTLPSITPTAKGMPQTSPGAKTLRGIGPSAPKTAPRPTGIGSASPVGKKSPKKPSRSVGPKAITRPVNPMQLASRLQSDQQRARLDSAPGTGPTREEMLAGTGTGDNAILPGQFDPLKGQSAFGREAEAPGSMSESSDRTDDAKGGGPVMSDLERQRAMQFSQAQMAAAAGASGVAGAGQTGTETAAPGAITVGKKSAVAQTSPQEQTIEETEQTIEEQVPADQKQPGKKGSDLQTAQNIASAMNMEKTAKVLGAAQAVKGNIEAVRKVQKTAQTFWNIIKAGELAAGVSILSLVILIITANLQMINKYTFKNRIIPPTFLIEDAAIICVNCALCGASCISVTAMPFIMIPLIGSLILMAGLLGLDFLDIFDLGIM